MKQRKKTRRTRWGLDGFPASLACVSGRGSGVETPTRWDQARPISVARQKKVKDLRRNLPNLGPMKQQPMREQPPASRWTTPGCFRTCSYFHWNVVFLIIEAALSKSYYDNPAEHLSLQSLWSSRGSPGRKDISSTDQLISARLLSSQWWVRLLPLVIWFSSKKKAVP